jgi:hypothetical protein
VNRETCTWNSISTDQYKIYLIPGAPQEYLSDAGTTLFYMFSEVVEILYTKQP